MIKQDWKEDWAVLEKILEDCSDNVINWVKKWYLIQRQKDKEAVIEAIENLRWKETSDQTLETQLMHGANERTIKDVLEALESVHKEEEVSK